MWKRPNNDGGRYCGAQRLKFTLWMGLITHGSAFEYFDLDRVRQREESLLLERPRLASVQIIYEVWNWFHFIINIYILGARGLVPELPWRCLVKGNMWGCIRYFWKTSILFKSVLLMIPMIPCPFCCHFYLFLTHFTSSCFSPDSHTIEEFPCKKSI